MHVVKSVKLPIKLCIFDSFGHGCSLSAPCLVSYKADVQLCSAALWLLQHLPITAAVVLLMVNNLVLRFPAFVKILYNLIPLVIIFLIQPLYRHADRHSLYLST